MFVITTPIKHKNKSVDVYYVDRGTSIKDTVWSDDIDDAMEFTTSELAESFSEELVEETTVRDV